MAYSNFKLKDLRQRFGIEDTKENLFHNIAPLSLNNQLEDVLLAVESLPLLSEKSRSEVIVMPILWEMLKRNHFEFSLFSGINLDADIAQGLNGECDFILSKTPRTFDLRSPIFTLIEAKDNDIEAGVPQCAAQMLGARIYNEQEGYITPCIYGCVTTGTEWQFLKLSDNQLIVNSRLYYLSELIHILGVLQYIIDSFKI